MGLQVFLFFQQKEFSLCILDLRFVVFLPLFPAYCFTKLTPFQFLFRVFSFVENLVPTFFHSLKLVDTFFVSKVKFS